MQAQARAQTTGVALNHFRAVVAAAAALGMFLFFVFGCSFLLFNVPYLPHHLPFVLEQELATEVFTGRRGTGTSLVYKRELRWRDTWYCLGMEIQ